MINRASSFKDKILLASKIFLALAKNPKALQHLVTATNIRRLMLQYEIGNSSTLRSKIREKILFYSSIRTALGCIPPVHVDKPQKKRLANQTNRVLILDRSLPTYDKDSGSLRMYNILAILSELGYEVIFIPDDAQEIEPYSEDLKRLGIKVLYVDIAKYVSARGASFSCVILSRPELALKHMSLVRSSAPNSIVMYDTVDLHWVRLERASLITRDKNLLRDAKQYKSVEIYNAELADLVFTVTPEERTMLLRENPRLRVNVLPNIHDVVGREVMPFARRRDLMFIGGFLHKPNEDAVSFFIEKIFPLVKEKIRNVRFYVVGNVPAATIKRLKSDDVLVTGYVRDAASYFENSRVFVSPLRYGSGMKGKVGESMSYGLPVVTTTVGAEGIGLTNMENALIADDPRDFADAVCRLYTDAELWNRISSKSMEHIDARFSKASIRRELSALFTACGI
jgi:glycosyltransferase involved in cell wall biosynthesis